MFEPRALNTSNIHYIRSPTYLPKNQEISLDNKHKHQIQRQTQKVLQTIKSANPKSI